MAYLVLRPLFKKRIWGSHYFKEQLNYPLDDELYGELWSLSAHPEGETLIINGPYKGYSINKLYQEHKELFNSSYDEFPLMIKLLSTSDVLSVQVHPDDDYARRVENQYGKTECWYFLDTLDDAAIIYGHHAKTRCEMEDAINKGECEKLLDTKKVTKGDFALIPSRTVHSPGKGLLFLEVQQSSNLTYRLYDYNRKDKDGNLRELHVKKGLDVIDFPQKDLPVITNYEGCDYAVMTDCDFFKVIKKTINGITTYHTDKDIFHIITVSKGLIKVVDGEKEYKLSLGESFMTTSDENNITLSGSGEVLISYPKH